MIESIILTLEGATHRSNNFIDFWFDNNINLAKCMIQRAIEIMPRYYITNICSIFW